MSNYPSTHKTLLEKIQTGDEVSWQEFYDRYSPVIRSGAAAYGLSEHDTEEVLQEVMLKFFQHQLVMKYDAGKARFRTYFNQVLVSCIFDFLRQQKRRSPEVKMEKIPEEPVPAEADKLFLSEWRKQMLQEALDQLRAQVKPETFLAFHLTAFQGKSALDAAKFLNIDVNKVYVAKSRCVARLQEIIRAINTEDPDLNLKWDS